MLGVSVHNVIHTLQADDVSPAHVSYDVRPSDVSYPVLHGTLGSQLVEHAPPFQVYPLAQVHETISATQSDEQLPP